MKNKYLIINADDFGLSPGISRGIIHACHFGLITSVSVIVHNQYLRDTKKYILKYPQIDWGIHVIVNNDEPVTCMTIEKETVRQIKLFKNFFHINPSHFDYHKGFKFDSKIYFSLRMLSIKNGISFRYDNHHYVNTDFYGLKNNQITLQDITVGNMIKIIKHLPGGVTEIVCHPGWTGRRLKDPYRTQRNTEVLSLTNPSILDVVKKGRIRLINFKDYKLLHSKTSPTNEN